MNKYWTILQKKKIITGREKSNYADYAREKKKLDTFNKIRDYILETKTFKH